MLSNDTLHSIIISAVCDLTSICFHSLLIQDLEPNLCACVSTDSGRLLRAGSVRRVDLREYNLGTISREEKLIGSRPSVLDRYGGRSEINGPDRKRLLPILFVDNSNLSEFHRGLVFYRYKFKLTKNTLRRKVLCVEMVRKESGMYFDDEVSSESFFICSLVYLCISTAAITTS